MANDNSICNHPIDSKMYVVLYYGSWKSCVVFGSYLSTHAICRSFLMIMGKKRKFLQILANVYSIFIDPLDSKIFVVIYYGSRKSCILFGSDLTNHYYYFADTFIISVASKVPLERPPLTFVNDIN